MRKTISLLAILLLAVNTLVLVSAITVSSVNSDDFAPGKEGKITIEIENTLNTDVEDVSLQLNFKNLPFIPVGSSTKTEEEIQEGDEESYSFSVRASNDITPGDYQIPYEITFYDGDERITREGSIGISVKADSEISYSLETENPVIGREGKITLKIVNKGFADAKFVLVKLAPVGFTLLSEDEIYIGTVDSDDFETANFDVIFNEKQPVLSALVEYRDFDNKKITETINLPINVYTQEKAIELGIIQRNNTFLYIGIAALVVILWFVWRAIKKRRRMKQSMRK